MPNSRRAVLAGTAGLVTTVAAPGCTDLIAGDSSNEEDEPTDEELDPESEEPGSDGSDLGADGWPGFQRTPANTGYSPDEEAPVSDPSERWRTDLPAGVGDQVAVVDGADGPVALATTDGETLHAITAATGEERWSRTVDGLAPRCPAVADGLVLVGTDRGELQARDLETGDEAWTVSLPGPAAGATVAGRTAYVGTTGDPFVCAVDLDGVSVTWTAPLTHDASGYPAVSESGVYAAAETGASLQGAIHALDVADGTERWSEDGSRMQSPTLLGESVAAPSLSINLYTTGGRHHARMGFGGNVLSSPAVADGTIYAGSTGGRVGAFSPTGGGTDWNVEVGGRPTTAPAVTDAAVYVTRAEEDVVALHRGDGSTLWGRSVEGEYATSPTVADGAVFVGSDSGRLVAFD